MNNLKSIRYKIIFLIASVAILLSISIVLNLWNTFFEIEAQITTSRIIIVLSFIVLIISIAIGFLFAIYSKKSKEEIQNSTNTLFVSQEGFDSIISILGFGLVVFNKKMEVCRVNNVIKQLLKSKNPENRKCEDLICSNSDNEICSFCPSKKAFADGKIHEANIRSRINNGTLHFRIIAYPVKNSLNEVDQVIMIYENLTDKIRINEKLTKSEERYRNFIDKSEIGVYGTNLEGEFLFANPSFLRIFGYKSIDELKKITIKSFYENDQERQKFIKLIMKDKKTDNYELKAKTKSGEIKYIYINSIIEDNIISGMVNDITKIKLIELELERNEALLESFINNSPTIVSFKSPNGEYQKINKKFENIINITNKEIIGKIDQDIFPKEIADNFRNNDLQVVDSAKMIIAEEIVPQDNVLHHYLSYKFPLFDKNKKLLSVCGIAIDISDRKKDEKRIERLINELKEKNEELEQIIYISSHDLRSPLVNVQGFSIEMKNSINEVSQIIKSLKLPQETKAELLNIIEYDIEEAVLYINSSANKIDELLSGLLKLSRAGRGDMLPEKVEMNLLFRRIIQLYETTISEKNIKIESKPLPNCYSNSLLVNQIFSNIISNSIKYRHPNRQAVISIDGYIENNYAIYSIKDNGIGIPKKNHEKIFNIFFRMNNRKTEGDGLGLTIVRKLITKLNGKIWLEAEEGYGSTFFIQLPTNP
ncbi:MAG: PAS domain S-box protein [Bacteroidetes bacterium]|jgi:PAS domain S-box-containing protein|nr:PAS domain S-box protein [Bacteroidota bacterium]MBT6687682.1 PAS domain S-box protein [Bacteroidota bacterium]MBT7142502.1 PAS domain S-box protein [Bacteroidota bacterium]MBT7493451.1 PAS domain S-box protein [Bacteroidota bacterium]